MLVPVFAGGRGGTRFTNTLARALTVSRIAAVLARASGADLIAANGGRRLFASPISRVYLFDLTHRIRGRVGPSGTSAFALAPTAS